MAVWNSFQAGTRITDPVLSQISVGWPAQGFVGEALFPTVPVTDKSAKYYVFTDRHTTRTPEVDYRAPGTQANEIPGMALSSDTYFTMEHALQMAVTDEERENIPAGSGLNPEADAVEILTGKLTTAREIAIKNLVSTPGNYATGHSKALIATGNGTPGSATWSTSDYADADSDPALVIETAKRRVARAGSPPLNTAIIPGPVMSFLRWHPKLLAKFTNISSSNLTDADVIATLGLTGWNVIVPEAQYNTAAVGQAASMDYIWGDTVVLAYVPPAPGLKTPAFGYQFMRYPLTVDRWREEVRRVDVVRTQWEYDLKLIGLDGSGKLITGYVITNTITDTDYNAL
jgi:hypothetical protein